MRANSPPDAICPLIFLHHVIELVLRLPVVLRVVQAESSHWRPSRRCNFATHDLHSSPASAVMAPTVPLPHLLVLVPWVHHPS